jgi:ATP-dependent DNA helicase RecG
VVEQVAIERDGFKLAEVDLQMRGPEALLGERATEMPVFRWADPPRDRELLLKARADAFELLQQDPGLRRGAELQRVMNSRWGEWLGQQGSPESPRKGQDPRSSRKMRRRRRRR